MRETLPPMGSGKQFCIKGDAHSSVSLTPKLLHIPARTPHTPFTHTNTPASHFSPRETMAITNTNYRQMIQDALESQQSGSSYDDIKTYIFTNFQVKKGFGNWVEHILKQMVAKGEVSKDEDAYILAKHPTSSKKSTLSVCAMRRRRRKWRKRSKSRRRRSRSRRRRRRRSRKSKSRRRRRSRSRKSRSRSRARSLRRRRRSRRRRTRSSARRGKRRSVSRARRRGARRVGGRRKRYSRRGKRSGLKRYRKRRASRRRYRRKRSCCFRKAAKVACKKIRYSLKHMKKGSGSGAAESA